MFAILCVAALAATALGSPTETVFDGADKVNRLSTSDLLYTVQVLDGGSYLGPGALVNNKFVICAGRIVSGAANSGNLNIRAGTDLRVPFFNPFGQSVKVAQVQVHQDADVAVLVLADNVTNDSAKSILVATEDAKVGSRAVVSGWEKNWWNLKLGGTEVWLVDAKECSTGLCASGGLGNAAILVVNNVLVGLTSGKTETDGVFSYVSLTERSVQQFLATALGFRTTEAPVVSTTPVPSTKPTVTAAPTSAPVTTQRPATTQSTNPTKGTTTTTKPTAQPTVACTISTKKNGLPNYQPLILRTGSGLEAGAELQFHEPDVSGTIKLAAGESVRLVCAGTSNYFKIDKATKDLTATCVSGSNFKVAGSKVALSQLGCKTHAYHSSRANGKCGNANQYTRIQIGFVVGDEFVTQYIACFDGTNYDAIYSSMKMTPGIAGHESGVSRPSFLSGTFYEGFSPNTMFSRSNQQNAVGTLLGDSSLGSKYVQSGSSSNYFLARGHLSAKADYIQGPQQRATFWYVNAAPQWQTFNGDNWNNLEIDVRNWVINNHRTVQVITGTWETATLPNTKGVETKLYLKADTKHMRIPKYYWKVVYDPVSKEGVAFVGMNNPYHVTTSEDILCKDVCSRYTWLSWDAKNEVAGYSFCCDVNELRKVITDIPNELDVKSLL